MKGREKNIEEDEEEEGREEENKFRWKRKITYKVERPVTKRIKVDI